jgi:hypothetical protein
MFIVLCRMSLKESQSTLVMISGIDRFVKNHFGQTHKIDQKWLIPLSKSTYGILECYLWRTTYGDQSLCGVRLG